MNTTGVVFNYIFLFLGLLLLGAMIRWPKAFFIETPLAIFGLILHYFKEAFFIDFFLAVFGSDPDYKTRKKRYLTFSRCKKLMITTGTDEGMVKIKIAHALESTNQKLTTAEFKFHSNEERTVTIPPEKITFHDFNYLIQYLTDGRVRTIGVVESKRIVFTVHQDPDTTNLIGETDKGEKFYISLEDNFDHKQFLRINNEIEVPEEYRVSAVRQSLTLANQ
jgi:hypothetical protein